MLRDLVAQAKREKRAMDELKRQGREKSVTCRQYMGNRLMYQQMLSLYRKERLIEFSLSLERGWNQNDETLQEK